MQNAVHFVRFASNARIARAAQIFGTPDFLHRKYDQRCLTEIMPGDVVVFAEGDEHQKVNLHAFDDSAVA